MRKHLFYVPLTALMICIASTAAQAEAWHHHHQHAHFVVTGAYAPRPVVAYPYYPYYPYAVYAPPPAPVIVAPPTVYAAPPALSLGVFFRG